MKKITLILVLIISIFMVACNDSDVDNVKNEEPNMIGYVVSIDNDRILVVDSEPKDFSSTGGISEFYNAIWFSNAPTNINIGDKVKVWYDIVMDSYPGQSEAKHIELIPSPKPEGATLTESEAISKALSSDKLNSSNTFAVIDIDYDGENNSWLIKLKDIMGDREYNIEVSDN